MKEHTPAPWNWACDPYDPEIGGHEEASVGKIAPWGGYYIAHISTDVPFDQRKANARLIAAAPDLLETLETFASYFRSLNDVPIERATIKARSDVVKKMHDVIAKARGR